jgi:DNA-binding transcriptional LysR family regulator
MRLCLKRGLGVTLCPDVSVADALKAGRLVRLETGNEDDDASLVMIWHAEKWCSPLLRHFMKLSEGAMSG